MSIHKTLRTGDALTRSRNVLTRYERIVELERQGEFSTESSPFGLRKVRVAKPKKRGKVKKKKEEEDATTPTTTEE
jgi:small basic protein (TIGR04137 family)